MGNHLLLTVHLHDARYHGLVSEWPPSPARVFQALVAGTARGSLLDAEVVAALEWLESRPPPVIAAPRARVGRPVQYFVPNNDADTSEVSGDPSKIGEVRVQKVIQPHLLEGEPAFHYAWSLDGEGLHAQRLIAAALHLYQLGKGVDMAWATGELLDDDAVWDRLAQHSGTVHEPHGDDPEGVLPCPAVGSLQSLVRRFGAAKLRTEGEGRKAVVLYSNPPKPEFAQVSYRRSKRRLLFDLRRRDDSNGELRPWPLSHVVALTERLRDAAADRLRRALPAQAAQDIERVLIGRKSDGSDAIAPEDRVQIIPLASIGHQHADMSIRRFLLDVPTGTPLRADDILWAFSGLEPFDQETGEVDPFLVTRSIDQRMLNHYRGPSKAWHSITPVALPASTSRRRIEPTRRREQAKAAPERVMEEARAIEALRHALRHAGIRARLVTAQVRREPFGAHGERAEAFAVGTRFAKERLWHVSLEFDEAIEGPLRIGDGRFLGLGVMAPAPDQLHAVHAFEVLDGLVDGAPAEAVTRALRRAVMARVQATLGRDTRLPAFFCGHAEDGAPARREVEPHLAFAFDPASKRLLVLAPHLLDRRELNRGERKHLHTLDHALDGFTELRAGEAGRLTLSPVPIDDRSGRLFAHSREWETATPYVVTRHAKGLSAAEALAVDVRGECRRVGLPEPSIEVSDVRGVSGLGLVGNVRMSFEVAVAGPIVLGKDRYLGGGMFRGVAGW